MQNYVTGSGMAKNKKRNHHIPRALLNFFASKIIDGEKYFIWQVDQRGQAVEASTKDVAVSPYFYGDPSTGVEDMFNPYEGKLRSILRQILEGTPPHDFATDLRVLVWQQVIRTNALRSQFSVVAERIMKAAIDSMDSAGAKAALVAMLKENYNQIVSEIVVDFPAALQAAAHARFNMPDVKASLLAQFESQLQPDLLKGMFVQMMEAQGGSKALEASKRGQINGLIQLLASGNAPDAFQPTEWNVVTSNEPVILGDTAVYATDALGTIGQVIKFGSAWSRIYLPISPNSVLVASQGDAPTLSIPDINRASARLSNRYIYSATAGEAVTELARQIGFDGDLMSEEEIGKMVSEGWSQLIANPALLIPKL